VNDGVFGRRERDRRVKLNTDHRPVMILRLLIVCKSASAVRKVHGIDKANFP
jgi:hypothetical protein